RLVYFQHCHERLLRNFYRSDLTHAFLSFLLLLQQFSLTRDVTAVTLRDYVLTDCADRFTRNNFLSDSCLNGDLKHVSRNQLLQLLTKFPAPLLRFTAVNDRA